MSKKTAPSSSETIERGNIVNKDTFNSIRDNIESVIAAGQREVIANVNATQQLSAHKNVNGESQLPKIEEHKDERGHWGSKAEFILSCVGFSVS
jgi:hypothetical protein